MSKLKILLRPDGVFSTMKTTEHHAVIKFFSLGGLSATEIHIQERIASSFSTVLRSVSEFDCGFSGDKDEPCSES